MGLFMTHVTQVSILVIALGRPSKCVEVLISNSDLIPKSTIPDCGLATYQLEAPSGRVAF